MSEPGGDGSRTRCGAISTSAGVLVFLVFSFAVQLLFALYASSTVTAVANDRGTRG